MSSAPLQSSFLDLIYANQADRQAGLAQEPGAGKAATTSPQPARSRKAQQQHAARNLTLDTQNRRAAELLAIVAGLDRDEAKAMVDQAGGVHKVAQMPVGELTALYHLTEKKAQRIRAMTDWALLLHETDANKPVQILSPADAANLVMLEMGLLDREQLRVIGVDTKNQVNFVETVYSGSINSAVLRVAEVLRTAVIMNCAAIILVHNHPSNDVSPSPEDISTTEMIRQAAKLHDIAVLDHLIIGRNRYLSFKEKGIALG